MPGRRRLISWYRRVSFALGAGAAGFFRSRLSMNALSGSGFAGACGVADFRGAPPRTTMRLLNSSAADAVAALLARFADPDDTTAVAEFVAVLARLPPLIGFLAAGFVLVTWTVMFLGWFQRRHFNELGDVPARRDRQLGVPLAGEAELAALRAEHDHYSVCGRSMSWSSSSQSSSSAALLYTGVLLAVDE